MTTGACVTGRVRLTGRGEWLRDVGAALFLICAAVLLLWVAT